VRARRALTRSARPRLIISLCTATLEHQEDRPPSGACCRHSSATASALSVWYECATGECCGRPGSAGPLDATPAALTCSTMAPLRLCGRASPQYAAMPQYTMMLCFLVQWSTGRPLRARAPRQSAVRGRRGAILRHCRPVAGYGPQRMSAGGSRRCRNSHLTLQHSRHAASASGPHAAATSCGAALTRPACVFMAR